MSEVPLQQGSVRILLAGSKFPNAENVKILPEGTYTLSRQDLWGGQTSVPTVVPAWVPHS